MPQRDLPTWQASTACFPGGSGALCIAIRCIAEKRMSQSDDCLLLFQITRAASGSIRSRLVIMYLKSLSSMHCPSIRSTPYSIIRTKLPNFATLTVSSPGASMMLLMCMMVSISLLTGLCDSEEATCIHTDSYDAQYRVSVVAFMFVSRSKSHQVIVS